MNLIFCALAGKEGYQSGHNIQKKGSSHLYLKDLYLKNALVALTSAKKMNMEDECALVTNMLLPNEWKHEYDQQGIRIFYKEYTEFAFPHDYPWSLAFYKMCAYRYVLSMDYDNYCMLDTDTYTQASFEYIWRECRDNILLYDYSRSLYNNDYREICEEVSRYLGRDVIVSHWGGEFIAGSKAILSDFFLECQEIYKSIIEKSFRTEKGDEFILAVAAYNMKFKIKNAKAYIFRYWTSYGWYYTCSNYCHNPVVVLHCPGEKSKGFIRLFRYIVKHHELPSNNKVYKALHIDIMSYFIRNTMMRLLYFLKLRA